MEDLQTLLIKSTYPLYLQIKVLVNAKKTEIVKLMDDEKTWKIRISAPANDDKANKELMRFFRQDLQKKITIITGQKSRSKLIKIELLSGYS